MTMFEKATADEAIELQNLARDAGFDVTTPEAISLLIRRGLEVAADKYPVAFENWKREREGRR